MKVDIHSLKMKDYLTVQKAFYYASAGTGLGDIKEVATKALKHIAQGRPEFAHNELQSILFISQMIEEKESPIIDILGACFERGEIEEMEYREAVKAINELKKKSLTN